MNVRWSERALDHAEAAAGYIAHDRPLASVRWMQGLLDAVLRVGDFPESGRVVAGIDNPRLREVVYENVRVVYHIDPTEIMVLIVWHTRRDPRKLLRQLRAYRVPT